jgi:hypothetical protein
MTIYSETDIPSFCRDGVVGLTRPGNFVHEALRNTATRDLQVLVTSPQGYL